MIDKVSKSTKHNEDAAARSIVRSAASDLGGAEEQ
jgi:hypothetical protein